MTRPPSQRLDADERALAALLPRPHGRVEPGPELDARILAAARAATQPQPANGPRRRWIGPAALAASLVLAVGLAWQMRAPPAADAPVQATDAASADPAATPMQAFEAPPASPALEDAPPEHVVAQTRRAAATVAATHAAAPPAGAGVRPPRCRRLPAVTCTNWRPLPLSAAMDATVTVRSASRPLKSRMRVIGAGRYSTCRVSAQPTRRAVKVEELSAMPKVPPRSTTTSTRHEMTSGSEASSAWAV